MVLKLGWFGRKQGRAKQTPEETDEASRLYPALFAPPNLDAFEMFTLRSSSGFAVYANTSGRLVTSRSHPDGASAQIVCLRFNAVPGMLFLMTIDPAIAAIDMDHDALRARVLSYTIVEVELIGKIRLRHPEHGGFVAAAPSEVDAETDLTSNRAQPDLWELLELVPLSGRLSAPFSRITDDLSRVLDGSDTANALIAWLRDGSSEIVAEVGPAVLRTATPEMLGRIGYAAVCDPALFDRLLSLLAIDPWVSVLRDLRSWLKVRTLSKQISIDKDLDRLAFECAIRKAADSIGSRLVAQIRRHVEPRRQLAVLATARNEGIYLLEFVAHYRALGAEHVFIYSNDNNDSSDELLAALAAAGAITWVNNVFAPHVDGQTKAYSHYLTYLPDGLDYEWTLIVDFDEFIVLDTEQYPSLPHLLRERRAAGANAMAMSWMVFTPSGRYRWEPAPLIARFDHREPQDNTAIKSAFVTRDAVSSYPHDPVFTPGVTVNYVRANGDAHWWPTREIPPSNGPPIYRNAWVNHYFFKSAEEFIWKASRNRGGFKVQETLRVEPEGLAAVAKLMEEGSPIDVRARRHLPALEAALAELRALPGIADAEAKVVATFRARVDQLLAEANRSLAATSDDAPFKLVVGRMLARIEAPAREPVGG